MSNDRFIRVRECCLLTSLSRTTLWRLEQSGHFPKKYRISGNVSAYRLSEVSAWMDRVAA